MFRTKRLAKNETHFISNHVSENRALLDNVWRYVIARQVSDVSAIFAHVIRYIQKYMSIYLT